MRIDIPPLRSRREDIPSWFSAVLSDTCRAIGRQIHLTDEASSILQDFDWPGNLDQMSGLCVRLVLLSEKRSVSADDLLHHLREMTNEKSEVAGIMEETIINPRAQELLDLLAKHTYEIVWLRGHAGHPENERCDKLAVAQSMRYKEEGEPQ